MGGAVVTVMFAECMLITLGKHVMRDAVWRTVAILGDVAPQYRVAVFTECAPSVNL